MSEMLSSTEIFRQGRDFLVAHRDDYETARARFKWPQIDQFNWAIDWFDKELAAGERGDNVALRIVGHDAAERTFAELSLSSNRVASALLERGLKRGDRILLMLGNCVALWETMLASMKIGAITVPTSMLATPDDVRDRLSHSGARLIVTTPEIAEKLSDLPATVLKVATGTAPAGWEPFGALLQCDPGFFAGEPTCPDEPILLYFTSGTTSAPKLVLHTHRSYGIGSLSTMYWLGLGPGDRHLNVSSPGWAKHAWSCLFAPWNAGATVIIFNRGRFNSRQLLEDLVAEKVTSFCAPPTAWRSLVQEDLASYPVSLTNVCAAGEPLNPEVIEVVQQAWDLTIRDGFGQTETTALIANSPGQNIRIGAVGRPLPGYDIVLLDADGHETTEGEIAVRLDPRPAGLMTGYLAASGEVQQIVGDYHRTGDIASRDVDGWYTYIGRADDVFKASDYRISPFELESALVEHEWIVEAAVVPAPDAARLNIPKAFVTLVDGIAPSSEVALHIFRHIAVAVAPYKRIRRLEFCALPKTISGKIRRVELRKLEMDRSRTTGTIEGEYRWENFVELQSASGG